MLFVPENSIKLIGDVQEVIHLLIKVLSFNQASDGKTWHPSKVVDGYFVHCT